MSSGPGNQNKPDRRPGASFPQLNPNPIIGVDSSGHVTFLNDGATRALEGIGKDASPDVFLPKDMDEILAALKRRERATFRREVAVGDLVFDESIYVAPEDNAVGIYATDITERKRTEQALRESEERFRLLLHQASDAIYVYELSEDRAGRFLEVNDSACRILGYSRSELLAMEVGDITTPGSLARMPEIVSVLRARGSLVFVTENRTKDGRTIPLEVNARLFDLQGRTVVLAIARDITERKQAETALRESEERFRQAFEDSAIGKLFTGLDGRLLRVNRAFAEMLGYTVEELQSMDFMAVTHTDDVAVSRETMIRLQSGTEGSARFEMRYLHKNGSVVWVDLSAVLLRDATGRPHHFVTDVQDITERKLAEAALRESEERFRLLLHQASDAIYVYELSEDRAGRFLEVNDSACRILGYSRSELLAMEVGDIEVPGGLARMPEIVSVLRARGSLVFVTENRTKDGSTVPFEVNARLFDLQGRTVVLAIARNITERKQAEEREKQHLEDTVMLRDTALGFIQLAHDADVYQYVADRLSGVVGEAYVIVNSYDETTDQFTVRAVAGIGAQLEAVVKLMGRNPVGTVFTLAREHRSEYASEKLLKFEDGTRELSYGKLPGVLAQTIEKTFDIGGIYAMGFHWQGRVLGSVNIIMREGTEVRDPALVESFVNQVAIALQHRRDTDELDHHRVHLEELVRARTREMELANKELEAFSYSVSHDLRAPLRAINGFAQALLDDCAAQLDTVGRGYLDRVRAASRRMAELIDHLLNLARIARLPLERKPVNLSELARTIAGELREDEPARQVELVIQDGMTAQADPVLAAMVLRNLLGNAWKFTGKHPTARIEVGETVRDGEPVWFVRDDGAGFDMAYVDNLFAPFQRLHTTADFAGTGIGLATVQRIVRRHGGRGWIEGAVEKGATYYFTFTMATKET